MQDAVHQQLQDNAREGFRSSGRIACRSHGRQEAQVFYGFRAKGLGVPLAVLYQLHLPMRPPGTGAASASLKHMKP